MNERIKDFLDEATEIHDDRNTGVSYPVVDYKIFAELIVRECVEIAAEQKKWVEDQVVFNARDETWNKARIQQSQRIVNKIKEHFGVE